MPRIHVTSFICAAVLSAVAASQAEAITVNLTPTVDFINATVNVNGKADGSGDTPVAFATETDTQVVSDQGFTSIDTTTGTAIQNENGFSSLELKVDTNGQEGIAATGIPGAVNSYATAIRKITFTNNTSFATVGTFSFSLSGIELETFRATGTSTDTEARVFFDVGSTNNQQYEAKMTLRGVSTGSGSVFSISGAQNMSGPINLSSCFAPGDCQKATVPVDPLSGSITLGVVAPGDSVSVFTTFRIETQFDRFENGAQAKAIDPGSYSWNFTQVGGTPIVPLPAGGWLILTGLGAFTLLRRRRGRA